MNQGTNLNCFTIQQNLISHDVITTIVMKVANSKFLVY